MAGLDSTPAVPEFVFFVNGLVMRTFIPAPVRPYLHCAVTLMVLAFAPIAEARTELATLSSLRPAAPASIAPQDPREDSAVEEHPGEDEGPISFQELKARLNDADRITALNALKIALDEVGDGGTFTWSKAQRQLKGIIKPTSAFRDGDGRVCRHVIYALRLADYTKQIETIACRQPDGRWKL